MIIVTGGAGFVGSNIVKNLNDRGIHEILVVDDLTDGKKFKNIVDCRMSDYVDKDDFIKQLIHSPTHYGKLKAIFHQGACSDTTEWNGHFMMKNNYEYSKQLLHVALALKVPFIYASSAAVYGNQQIFQESPEFEKPLNVYGYSKLLFDQYVRQIQARSSTQIVGLRYFNVYGPREFHKGGMASVALHNHLQLQEQGWVKLFEGSNGYAAGEQRRDFIYVEDVVKVNFWFFDHPEHSGIFNVGTGKSQTFKEISEAVIAWHGRGHIEFIPFPKHLQGCYQAFTEADIRALRKIGYEEPFKTVQQGVPTYLNWLAAL